ncbi:MAG: hypothetical protein PHV63_00055 [Candidatus Daviesbacteria bacterium]|nr:hypothetical protein [Candidatus Daviesbacteria bacterium]
MLKEVHIDIGGGRSADYFVSMASVDKQGTYVVLDPEEFRCPYTTMYPNLRLVRWGANEKGTWELPFADSSIFEANINFIYDCVGWSGCDRRKAYDSIIKSLKRVLKPDGVIYVREPQCTIESLAERFKEHDFQVTEPFLLEKGVSETSIFMRRLSKDFLNWGYSPMLFEARLG